MDSMELLRLYKEISGLLKDLDNRILPAAISKGESELVFLKQWLKSDLLHKPGKALSPVPDNSIDDTIRDCNKCDGIIDKKNGFGSGTNGVMVILNSPRMLNKVEREIHKKESISLLKKIISAIQLKFDECYITNVIKCETASLIQKPSQMVENCTTILVQEIDHYKPRIIIVMGDLVSLQKVIKNSKGISWFNIDHPITLIKNPDLKRNAWKTLKLVMKEFNSGC